jgi:rRNA maturation endonuclease Nob1
MWTMGWFILFCLMFALVVTAMQSRHHAALTDRKRCRFCGAIFAADARFCGRCGHPL